MLKEIEDVRQNAWKDAFNKMPIFDSIKNRLHDLEAKIGVITVNRVGRNKMTEDKEKEESQQEEMICEKDSKEEKKPRKKRGPNKKKESVGNKEEQGGEIKTEQREGGPIDPITTFEENVNLLFKDKYPKGHSSHPLFQYLN